MQKMVRTQAVEEARATGPSESLIQALGNLGNVYALLEHYEQKLAENLYRELLAVQRQHQSRTAIGETLVNLGNLQSDAGEPEKSKAYYLEAIDLLNSETDTRALGILYSNLALQELKLSRPSEAIQYFQSALDFHRAVGNEDGLATTYGQLGKAFLSMGQNPKAEACLNNASEHFIKLGNEAGEAGALRYWLMFIENGETILLNYDVGNESSKSIYDTNCLSMKKIDCG